MASGYRSGTGRWVVLGTIGGVVVLVLGAGAGCTLSMVHALSGTTAIAHPTDSPLHPVSAYVPAQSFAPNDAATPYAEPTRMTVSVSSIAQASSKVTVPAQAATAAPVVPLVTGRTASPAIAVTAPPTMRRVVTDMQFASRDQAQDAQARADLTSTRPRADREDPEASATDVGYVRPSRYELGEQDFIAGRLTVDVNSERPGQVLAVVTVPVYDSATHTTLLIPAGTMLQGDDSTGGVSGGQSRLLVTWRDLIFPNNVRFEMGSGEGADARGAAGIPGDVDSHRGRAYGQAALYTLLSAAGSLLGNLGNHSQVFLPSGGSGLTTLFAQQAQSLQPTISIPADSIIHVYATRPLPLRPYAEVAGNG